MYVGPNVQHPLFSSDLTETCILSTDFRKILKFQISFKSVQWEPSLLHADGQTDRHDVTNGRLSQFYEGP